MGEIQRAEWRNTLPRFMSRVGFPRNATCVLNHMQHSVKMSRKGNKACVKLSIEQQELLINLVEEHPNFFLFLKMSWTPYLCWRLLWASNVNLMRFKWFLWRQRRIKRKSSSSMLAIFTSAKSCACALCPYTHPTPFGAPKFTHARKCSNGNGSTHLHASDFSARGSARRNAHMESGPKHVKKLSAVKDRNRQKFIKVLLKYFANDLNRLAYSTMAAVDTP